MEWNLGAMGPGTQRGRPHFVSAASDGRLPGTSSLRALVAFDELYGFLPPHPHSPPTKRPLVALVKQARAFGVGLLLATQNPMDLHYRALSNAGLWCLGRLQTDADRARVVESLAGLRSKNAALALTTTLQRLGPRWFVTRDTHRGEGLTLLNPRHAISFLRGPMMRAELVRVRELHAGSSGNAAEDARVTRLRLVGSGG